MIKCLPKMRETQVQSLSQEDLPEKEMATHSSILAWKIPWMEKSGSPWGHRKSMNTVHEVTKSRPLLSDFTSL